MSDIATKLTYLNDTKDLFKDRLNSLGAEITSSTTFRNYLTWLDTFYEDASDKTDLSINGVVGRTSQETTTGKNLFDIDTISSFNQNLAALNNGLITTINLTQETANIIPVFTSINLPSDTYYLSMDIRIKSGSGNFSKINDGAVAYEEVSKPTLSSTFQRYVYKHTYDSSKNLNILMVQFSNSTNAVYEIKNIMISTSNDTTYEEYTGGQPSPNPDYPQPINNLSGDVAYKVSWKNSFNPNNNVWGKFNVWEHSSGNYTNAFTNTFDVNGGQVCSILFKGSVPIRTSYQFLDDEDNYLSGSYWSAGTLERKYENISIPQNATKVIICQLDGSQTDDIKIQFEYNNTCTIWEPYIEPQTFNIPLGDIELCKIDTYEDKIYSSDGRFYLDKNIGKVVLNGSEQNWAAHSSTSGTKYRYWLSASNFTNVFTNCLVTDESALKNFTLCNEFKTVTFANTGYGKISIHNLSTINCFFLANMDDSNVTTVADWKTWLSNNNAIVYYPLETPTTTEITQENYPSLYNALKQIQDYLTAYKINKEFILGYSSPEIEY